MIKLSELNKMTDEQLKDIMANSSNATDRRRANEVLYDRLKYPENVNDRLSPEENYNGKRNETYA